MITHEEVAEFFRHAPLKEAISASVVANIVVDVRKQYESKQEQPEPKRGRPKGSKNKTKDSLVGTADAPAAS